MSSQACTPRTRCFCLQHSIVSGAIDFTLCASCSGLTISCIGSVPHLFQDLFIVCRIRMGFNCFFGTNTLKPQEQPDDDVRKELDYLEVKDIDWRAGMTSAQWSMMRNRLSEKCEDRMQQWKQCSSQEVCCCPCTEHISLGASSGWPDARSLLCSNCMQI